MIKLSILLLAAAVAIGLAEVAKAIRQLKDHKDDENN